MSRDTVLRDMKEDVRSLITDLTTRYQIIGKSLKLLKMTGEPSFYADSPIADEEEKYDESVEHLKESVMEFQRYCSAGPYRELIEKYIPELREATDEDELKSIYQKWTADLNKLKVDCNFMHRNLVTEIQQMLQFVRHLKAKEMESMDEATGFGRDLNRIHNEEGVEIMNVYENEITTLYESVVEMSSDASWMFLEEASDGVKDSFITKLVNKIIALKNSVVKWVQGFFNKRFSKNVEDQLSEAIKNDPSLKNKKVKVHDYKKLGKARDEAQAEVERAKSPAEVDEAMKKYKKKRAVILGTTVAITAVAALGFLRHKRKAGTSDLEKAGKKATDKLQNAVKSTDGVDKKKLQAQSILTSDGFYDYELEIGSYATVLNNKNSKKLKNLKPEEYDGGGYDYTAKGKAMDLFKAKDNDLVGINNDVRAFDIKTSMLNKSLEDSEGTRNVRLSQQIKSLKNKIIKEKDPEKLVQMDKELRRLQREGKADIVDSINDEVHENIRKQLKKRQEAVKRIERELNK